MRYTGTFHGLSFIINVPIERTILEECNGMYILIIQWSSLFLLALISTGSGGSQQISRAVDV